MRIIFFLTSCSLLRRNLAPPEMEWSYVLVPVFEHGDSYENTSTHTLFFGVGGLLGPTPNEAHRQLALHSEINPANAQSTLWESNPGELCT